MDLGNKVLFFFDYFHPAFKAGGPIRSSLALVGWLKEHCSAYVITRASDLNEDKILNGIVPDQWMDREGSKILYLKRSTFYRRLLTAVRNIDFDVYHFNSLFSLKFSIYPLLLIKLGILPRKKIVLSPRGECSPDALSIKSIRKRAYLLFFKSFIAPDVCFHATTLQEQKDIMEALNVSKAGIFVATNLRVEAEAPNGYQSPTKEKNSIKVIFLGRIARIKNIEFCLKVFEKVKTAVQFDIYGIIEDKVYFDHLMARANALPANIQCKFKGVVGQDMVISTISKYDLLFLPSKSENFGHVILESLLASRPVLISNNTSWKNLELYSAGWEFPLHETERFIDVIDLLTPLENEEFERFSWGAYKLAVEYWRNENQILPYLQAYRRGPSKLAS